MSVWKRVVRKLTGDERKGLHHNERGEELLDPTPVRARIPLQAHERLEVKIARMLNSAKIREEFMRSGIETFEEADDFDVGEDMDPETPYERDFDHATITAVDKGVTRAPERPQGFVDPRTKWKKPPGQPPRSEFDEEKPDASKKKKKRPEEDEE